MPPPLLHHAKIPPPPPPPPPLPPSLNDVLNETLDAFTQAVFPQRRVPGCPSSFPGPMSYGVAFIDEVIFWGLPPLGIYGTCYEVLCVLPVVDYLWSSLPDSLNIEWEVCQ